MILPSVSTHSKQYVVQSEKKTGIRKHASFYFSGCFSLVFGVRTRSLRTTKCCIFLCDLIILYNFFLFQVVGWGEGGIGIGLGIR